MIRLSLAYRPPFDWHSLLDYYRRHRLSGVETIEDDRYSRVFRLAETGATGFFRIGPQDNKPELLLEMIISDTRQLLKQCVLGVQFGMEAKTLAFKIGQPEIVARDLLRAYRETGGNL